MTISKAQILAAFPNAMADRLDSSYAASLSVGRTKLAPVQAAVVRGTMYAMGVWPAVLTRANAARANVDITPAGAVCQTLYDLALIDQPIPMDQPAINAKVTSDLNLLVAALIMTAQQEAIILALATVPDPISVSDVSNALNGV